LPRVATLRAGRAVAPDFPDRRRGDLLSQQGEHFRLPSEQWAHKGFGLLQAAHNQPLAVSRDLQPDLSGFVEQG
jgi:hypothetical protein